MAAVAERLRRAIDAGDVAAAATLAEALRATKTLQFADHLALARHASFVDDHTAAAIRYRAALKLKPKHVPAMVGLVEALTAAGNLPAAIAVQRRICRIGTTSIGHWMRLSKLLLANGQKADADDVARKILDLDGTGRFAAQFPLLDTEFEQVLASLSDGRDEDARRRLSALTLTTPRHFMQVAAGLRNLASAGDERLPRLSALLCENARGTAAMPKLVRVLRRAATEVAQLGHGQAAIDMLSHLLDIRPAAPDVLLQQATLFIGLGRTTDAIANLDRILTANPMDVRTANALAVHASVEQMAGIADRLAPRVIACVDEEPWRRADAIRILTRFMQFEQARALLGEQPLESVDMAEAAFDLATSTFDTALARRVLRECVLSPATEKVRDVWQLRIALIEAERGPLADAYDRLASTDNLGLLDSTLQNHAAIAIGRYREAFEFLRLLRRRADLSARLRNLYRFGEPLESLSASHVLVVGYTELGDEIRLLDLVDRARSLFASCTIAVDSRIAGLVARNSDRLAVVGIDKLSPAPATSTIPILLRQHVDQSLWDRISTFDRVFLIRDFEPLLVQGVEDLPRAGRMLKADDARRLAWRTRLRSVGPRPWIGLFWRSGKLTFRRLNRVTDLADWADILKTSGATVVSLQYGPRASAEIGDLGPQIGIVEFADLDAKDDLESVAALMCELDLVMTVPSATLHLAGALGVPTLGVTHPSQIMWRARPGTNIGTWNPTVEMVTGPAGQGFAGAVAAAGQRLRELLPRR